MAEQNDNVPLVFPPDSGISASQRLFSEEVGIAAAESPLPLREAAYVFSNGVRKYVDPYPGE